MYHVYSLLACISLIRLCHGQFDFSQTIDAQRAFDLSVDISTALTLVQEFVVTGNNVSNEVSLYNVSINFENGECVNPSVTIEHETIDNDGDDEALYVFYGSFNNDSQIARCEHQDSEICGAYAFCVDFQPPPGIYTNLLPFFISTGDDVGAFCGDSSDEEGPTRSYRARFTVFCEVDTQSICSNAGEGEDEGEVAEDASSSSSSEDRQNAVQEFGNRLEEDHDLMNDYKYNDNDNDNGYNAKPEVVTLEFAEETSQNFWIMFVVTLCVCMAQCGFICMLLYNKK